LRNALSDHGIHLQAQRDNAICDAAGVVSYLRNDDNDANTNGLIGCVVRRRPTYSDPTHLKVSASSQKTKFIVANIECTIYPHVETGVRRKAELKQALEEFAKSSK
jgi:hypothetical protein